MMRCLIFLLVVFTVICPSLQVAAQCPCPKMSLEHYGSKPVKVFKLTESDSVAVCGTVTQQNGREEYSDFIVYRCGQLFSVGSWDGMQTCTITQSHDTLFIKELYSIANGPGMTMNWVPFWETDLYLLRDTQMPAPSLVVAAYFRHDARKYTEAEIKQALAGYNSIHFPTNNYDAYLLAVHRLFWAYVSGSKEAGVHMEALRKKYGSFDGAVAEEFDDIIMTYEHYKKDNP